MIDLKKSISLGIGPIGKVKMFIFALLAPSKYKLPKIWRHLNGKIIPDIWISPATLCGLCILINPRDWSQTVIFEEIFLRNGYDLKKVKFTPNKIIDCGAHIGMFSLLAKSNFPRVPLTAFEPNPANLKYLRRQFEKNQINVEVVPAAVSNSQGKLMFHSLNSHSGSINHDSTSVGGTAVEVIDFPKYIKSLNLSSLLLKMDIEGEELRILPDLLPILPIRTAIFFELHSGEDGWNVMYRLFDDCGFQVEKINCRGIYIDAFAYRD